MVVHCRHSNNCRFLCSCGVSKIVWVCLITSMYFSGIGNDSFWRRIQCFSVQNMVSINKVSRYAPETKFRFHGVCLFFCSVWFIIFFSKNVNWYLQPNSNEIDSGWMCDDVHLFLLIYWTFSTRKCELFSYFGDHHFFFFVSFDVDIWSSVVSKFFCVCHEKIYCPAALRVHEISDKNIFEDSWAEMMKLVFLFFV